jgi:hypothetical protein
MSASAGLVAIKDYHPKWIARGLTGSDSAVVSFGAFPPLPLALPLQKFAVSIGLGNEVKSLI